MRKARALLLVWASLFHQMTTAAPCPMNSGRIERIVNRVAWVWTVNEDRVVKIKGTEIGFGGHVGHLGPIEVSRARGRSICITTEVDLVEQPFAFAGDKYFYFLSGDSIAVRVKVIDLKNCNVVWQSEPFDRDNVPVIVAETSSIFLSTVKVPIDSSCLPPLPLSNSHVREGRSNWGSGNRNRAASFSQ